MSAFAHSRSSSAETVSSGSSYQLILDHILAYPGTYEIPLRTMYTLNCAPRAQPLLHQRSRRTLSNSSNNTFANCAQLPPVGESARQAATAQFTSSLVTQISQLPQNHCSLPPGFIISFLRRCFPVELVMVDFPQALTGLDYLKDLEMRRRREIENAMRRLGIEKGTVGIENDEVSGRYPGVATWIKVIEEKEKKAEAFYTQLYISLRRWVLINELSLLPFNKHNCVAMLNTLYPPVIAVQPTSKLTPAILKSQRDGFFRYIQGVEKSGPGILTNLMNQGKRAGDENGWGAVSALLEMYLEVANSIIDECGEINDPDYFKHKDSEKRKGRKADSGVSFANKDRPSTTGSISGKPLAPSPAVTTEAIAPRNTSKLEKFAREFRKLRSRKKTDPEGSAVNGESTNQVKAVRKMRSLSSLRELRFRNASGLTIGDTRMPLGPTTFDEEEMQRKRLIHEANSKKHDEALKTSTCAA